jgi:hypothetical protein
MEKDYNVTIMVSNENQKKRCKHAHTSALHVNRMVACTWLGDRLGRTSTPASYKLHMARVQVLFTYLLSYCLIHGKQRCRDSVELPYILNNNKS